MPEQTDKEDKWFFLSHIMPDANELEKSKRKDLYGLVRRTIIKEREIEDEAIRVYRVDDFDSLKAMIQSLPFTSDDDIVDQVKELHLTQEEAELETSYWAFNHQSVRGDLISGDELIPFKLVRLYEYTYLLLSPDNNPEIAGAFAEGFGEDCGAFSGNALNVENEKWCGWAWFVDPDPVKRRDQARQLKEIWEGMNSKL